MITGAIITAGAAVITGQGHRPARTCTAQAANMPAQSTNHRDGPATLPTAVLKTGCAAAHRAARVPDRDTVISQGRAVADLGNKPYRASKGVTAKKDEK